MRVLLERELKLLRARPPLVPVARERLEHDRLERRRVLGVDRGRRRRILVADLARDDEVVVPAKQPPTQGQLPQDRAQREHVAAAVERLAAALLRRHVRDLALEGAVPGVGLQRGHAGDAEVDQLHAAVVADEDVRGRDVAVDDAERVAVAVLLVMGVVQPGGGADDDLQNVLGRQPPTLRLDRTDDLAQVLADDVLHREEEGAVVVADVVHLRDVGVMQRRRQASLRQQHPDEVLVVRVRREDPLERDQLLEAVLRQRPRHEQLRHPTDREPRQQLVLAEPHERRLRLSRPRRCSNRVHRWRL